MHKPKVRMKSSIVWFISILHQGLLMTPPKHLVQLNHFHFLTFQLFHFHFSRNISVTRLNQRIFKVLQSFIFAHSSISTAIQRSNNEDIKQQRGKRIRRFKESVHEYFPKNVPKFLDQETFRSRTSFIIN